MKFYFLLLLSCFVCSSQGQEKKLDCMLLQKAIQTEPFKKAFNLCNGNDDIYIVDTSKSFSNCTLNYLCYRKLFISNELIEAVSKEIINIYRIDRKRNIFTIYFHRPFNGIALTLKLKYAKGKAKLLECKSGAF